jgi:hypothetical protein
MRSSLAEPPLVSPYNPSAYYVYYNPYYYTSLCVCVCVYYYSLLCVCVSPPPLHPFPSSPGGGRKRVQKQEMGERERKKLENWPSGETERSVLGLVRMREDPTSFGRWRETDSPPTLVLVALPSDGELDYSTRSSTLHITNRPASM